MATAIKVKRFGNKVAQITLHLPPGVKEAGLKRFLGSKQFSDFKQQIKQVAGNSATNMATVTKKKAAKKTAKKKAVVKKEGGPGIIEQIIALHKKGKSNKEIIEAGYNKSTVGIQVAKYKRENGKSKK